VSEVGVGGGGEEFTTENAEPSGPGVRSMRFERDPLFDFTGKVVLVTGGSRGLGYEMVKAFAARGADVIVASRKIDNCERVADEVRGAGRRALAVQVHAAKWRSIDRLVDSAYREFGRVDVLVNNAGMSPAMPSHLVTEELFDRSSASTSRDHSGSGARSRSGCATVPAAPSSTSRRPVR
jgi:hypothetical protein